MRFAVNFKRDKAVCLSSLKFTNIARKARLGSITNQTITAKPNEKNRVSNAHTPPNSNAFSVIEPKYNALAKNPPQNAMKTIINLAKFAPKNANL